NPWRGLIDACLLLDHSLGNGRIANSCARSRARVSESLSTHISYRRRRIFNSGIAASRNRDKSSAESGAAPPSKTGFESAQGIDVSATRTTTGCPPLPYF